MSFLKIAELANKFVIKIAEHQYDSKSPSDKKASDFSPDERDFIKSLTDENQVDENNVGQLDEATWKRAKKSVKKYWNKYDEPWAVVYDVYRKMGGKPAKKKKKKS